MTPAHKPRKTGKHASTWFDCALALREDGTLGTGYVCDDCGADVDFHSRSKNKRSGSANKKYDSHTLRYLNMIEAVRKELSSQREVVRKVIPIDHSPCHQERDRLKKELAWAHGQLDKWTAEHDPAILKLTARNKRLEEALNDIANFHEIGLEEIEKRRGFLGWTCCSQTSEIAGQALRVDS